MYYSGSGAKIRKELKAIGYATSKDGIHWEKYQGNPVYRAEQDPFLKRSAYTGYMENPFLLYSDTICFMYLNLSICLPQNKCKRKKVHPN